MNRKVIKRYKIFLTIILSTLIISSVFSSATNINSNEKYKEYITTCKIDKNVIKKDLESGVEVKGAELKEYNNLQIK